MKKTLCLALLASQIMAAESGPYVGLYGGRTELKVKISNGPYSAEKEKEGNNGEIKIGYYVDNHHRVNAFYQNSKPVSDTDGEMYGIGYDYLIGGSDLKPFIGAVIGQFKVMQNSIELKDDFIGAQAGLNYSFLENFSVETGYRQMIAQGDQLVAGSTVFEADRIKNWFFGMNYKF